MATVTRSDSRVVPISPRRKSLWKMVRTMLLPRRFLSTFASCGGGGKSRKVSKLKRNSPGLAPTIPVPPPVFAEVDVESERITSAIEQLHLSTDSPLIIEDHICQIHHEEEVNEEEPRNRTFAEKKEEREFHGWRKSSIDISFTQPPVTLKWIPSGLQIGDKVMWVTDGQPERATVRWIGKIREQFTCGVEFERSIGNSSGIYGYGEGLHQRLFTCDLGFGKFVPVDELVLYSDFHDKGVKAGFICVICRDDFLQDGGEAITVDDGHMVATKCGHLYHEQCLALWFTKSRNKGGNPCPHCQNLITIDEIIRLFPAQV